MAWITHHNESVENATAAEVAEKRGLKDKALALYCLAAENEMLALADLDKNKTRTLGITIVSVVSLLYKAHEYSKAQDFAQKYLSNEQVPLFAREELNSIIEMLNRDQTNLVLPQDEKIQWIVSKYKDEKLEIGKNPLDLAFTHSYKGDLERAKLLIEEQKLLLEQNKLMVSTLLEDFKARWQELLNFENENGRWQTLYVTALILVISWVLSNSGESGKYKNIADIFSGDNSFLLLGLALVNAIYTLAMAYKGYQIQEIAQYLYANVGNMIADKTSNTFNSWEEWRRNKQGKPVLIRTVFYSIIGILPTAVSGTILSLYYYHRFFAENNFFSALNLFSYFVTLFVALSLITALLTTRMNKTWEKILAKGENE